MTTVNTRWVLNYLVIAVAGCVQQAQAGGGEVVDFSPADGVISGCKTLERDSSLVRVQCPWSLEGNFKQCRYYLMTADLEPIKHKRLVFNRILNTFFGESFAICKACSFDEYDKAAKKFRDSLDVEIKDEFLERVYQVRDSAVWVDGNATGAYDVFMSEFASKKGLELLNRAMGSKLSDGREREIQTSWVIKLIAAKYDQAPMLLKRFAESETEWPRIQMLAAVGLAHFGDEKQSGIVLSGLEAVAREQGDQELTKRLMALKETIRTLPNNTRDVESVLNGYFEED